MKDNIKLIIAYSNKFLGWVKEGRFHNFSIIIILATVLYFLKIISYEPKYISAAFLIFGLSIIITHMIGDAKRFSKHQPNTPKNWLEKFPTLRPKKNFINLSSASVVSTTTKAYLSISISENATLEEKVAFLLKHKEEMESSINTLDDKLDNKIAEVKKEIKGIESKIEQKQKEINSTISDITVSEYDLRLFSVVLMICGTFLQILI